MLQWLESTVMARESLWGYPIVLASHAAGMAILTGIVLIVNLRILELARDIPLSSFKAIPTVWLFGLAINVGAGVMLCPAFSGAIDSGVRAGFWDQPGDWHIASVRGSISLLP